jgi:L-histidine Nalpha-methyltransferase
MTAPLERRRSADEEALLNRPDWTRLYVYLDKASKLGELRTYLGREPSDGGQGKYIPSGFAYWGVGPTTAWCRACADATYPVMLRSIKSFRRPWHNIRASLRGTPYDYVSLGPGTGHKDHWILRDLAESQPDVHYFPVDMSSEMLRRSYETALGDQPILKPSQVRPIQLDFSDPKSLSELRKFIDDTNVDRRPLLVSLLGNTMANFDDDFGLLAKIRRELLRAEDRLIVEVATTSSVTPQLATAAEEEYRDAQGFKEWVVSALQHLTNLAIDPGVVIVQGAVEGTRALKVIVLYKNSGSEPTSIHLNDRSIVELPISDTIRLDLTRKYDLAQLSDVFTTAGLTPLDHAHEHLSTVDGPRDTELGRFGLEFVLLAAGQAKGSRWPELDVSRDIMGYAPTPR